MIVWRYSDDLATTHGVGKPDANLHDLPPVVEAIRSVSHTSRLLPEKTGPPRGRSTRIRELPALYAVSLHSSTAGEPGETAAAHSGGLTLDPSRPTADGAALLGAGNPVDAVRLALSGTITASIAGRFAEYRFMPGTSSLSPADQQPFRVEVAGDEGRVWLEDLAGLTDLGVDWDYDDRSWRVSVREYTDSGASGGSMTSGSSFGPTSSGNDYDLKLMGTGPVVETWSTWDGDEPWVSPFGKEVHVTVTVTAESDGNFCWHYLDQAG